MLTRFWRVLLGAPASAALGKFLGDCLTGADNRTYDVGRAIMAAAACAWLLAAAVFLSLEAYQVLALHTPFDMRGFGEGLGLVVAALTALHVGASWGLNLKSSTEPSVAAPAAARTTLEEH